MKKVKLVFIFLTLSVIVSSSLLLNAANIKELYLKEVAVDSFDNPDDKKDDVERAIELSSMLRTLNPNPIKMYQGYNYLRITHKQDGEFITVNILDDKGATCYSKAISRSALSEWYIDTTHILSAGKYTVILTTDNGNFVGYLEK
ncbi:DUF3244 domain-containing protein [Dysgonomonas sp. Marseille-P4677]|uniref:DUF3244 domain-containing protein n=1 Tax=Dysgonomonas sp. Marseille-P4677 TaxID=2364790 RepID=UPI001914C080|nr:DUF3244 domain-containing protein [Dysgonomonas sp. Marseille-P4677]MBK5722114.1 DUF3244 domain-containing protein [Dysgonomonas sp. Marseille-P4677]